MIANGPNANPVINPVKKSSISTPERTRLVLKIEPKIRKLTTQRTVNPIKKIIPINASPSARYFNARP
jgi:hypothetical protein|tara:strand:+ start:567 stop:770 length:204 start_codon:yes stop_codon:yes gene_type:complete